MKTETLQGMNRREAVLRIALLMGGAMVGSQVLLSGQAIPDKQPTAGFTEADRALLDEIGETIIPATDIPGAKAANIGAFMIMMVNDCYNDGQHAAFVEGLRQINTDCRARYGTSFMGSTAAQRTELANALDAEQKAKSVHAHYFRMFKDLTVVGYFSSEIGCTQAVRYIEVPGAFHGDYPYKKGDKAWF